MSVKSKDLHEIGADEVIAEEFETSVEIFTVVLNKYFVPRDQIESFITDVRADGYQMLRSRSTVPGTLPDLVRHISDITISSLTVEPGSLLAGITLGGYQPAETDKPPDPRYPEGRRDNHRSRRRDPRCEAGILRSFMRHRKMLRNGAGLFIHPDRS